jgi:glutaredoxin
VDFCRAQGVTTRNIGNILRRSNAARGEKTWRGGSINMKSAVVATLFGDSNNTTVGLEQSRDVVGYIEDARAVLMKIAFYSVIFVVLWACGNELPERLSPTKASGSQSETLQSDDKGEKVTPPFNVRDDLNGLLVVWFDKEGLHTADKRSQVPEARRQIVRVDSLQVAPEKRLDPEFVYIADLRKPTSNGSYNVEKHKRDWFEQLVDREMGVSVRDETSAPSNAQQTAPSQDNSAQVIIYGASWCGACRAAAQYLQKRHVAFVEKDIEKDKAAYAEMQKKAISAGIQPGALPLIDVRGHVMSGFNPDALDRLIK